MARMNERKYAGNGWMRLESYASLSLQMVALLCSRSFGFLFPNQWNRNDGEVPGIRKDKLKPVYYGLSAAAAPSSSLSFIPFWDISVRNCTPILSVHWICECVPSASKRFSNIFVSVAGTISPIVVSASPPDPDWAKWMVAPSLIEVLRC